MSEVPLIATERQGGLCEYREKERETFINANKRERRRNRQRQREREREKERDLDYYQRDRRLCSPTGTVAGQVGVVWQAQGDEGWWSRHLPLSFFFALSFSLSQPLQPYQAQGGEG